MSATHAQIETGSDQGALQRNERKFVEDLARISAQLSDAIPAFGIREVAGTAFGRHIEKQVHELQMNSSEILRLKIRKRNAAAVISWQRYEQMINTIRSLQDELEQLVSEKKASVVRTLGDEFETLLAQMRTTAAIEGADRMTRITDGQLRANYAPGLTEKPE